MNETENQESLFHRLVRGAFDYLELFVISIFAVLMIFTFGVRLCRVDGESMENTLHHNEYLLLHNVAYQPKQDDIIVFHLPETSNKQKTLVKRVIALEGQEVIINTQTNEITVDGIPYEDSHSVLKDRITDEITGRYDNLFYTNFDYSTGIYTATVPEGKVIVLGDNRNTSKDSRHPDIGFIDEQCILGKVILRLSPFTVLA